MSACFVEPMLCLAVDKLPEGPAWQYELKLDGYRAIGVRTKAGVAKQKGFLAPFSECRARSGGAADRDRSRWRNRRGERRWAAVWLIQWRTFADGLRSASEGRSARIPNLTEGAHKNEHSNSSSRLTRRGVHRPPIAHGAPGEPRDDKLGRAALVVVLRRSPIGRVRRAQ